MSVESFLKIFKSNLVSHIDCHCSLSYKDATSQDAEIIKGGATGSGKKLWLRDRASAFKQKVQIFCLKSLAYQCVS